MIHGCWPKKLRRYEIHSCKPAAPLRPKITTFTYWYRSYTLTSRKEMTTSSFIQSLFLWFWTFFFLPPFIFFSWRLITLQYCSGVFHRVTWISHGFTCIPHPDPPPTSLSTWSLWVFPVYQVRALVSCIHPGLVICFTLDNKHVSMLFSQNITRSPSPTECKSLFCTSVSLFLFCI